jgi:putative hemolysin
LDYSSYIFNYTLLSINPQQLLPLILLVLLLIVISFIISGAEVAFFSLGHKDINLLKSKDDDEAAKRVVTLIEKPKTLLASLLIANNVVNLAIIILSSLVLDKIIPFDQINIPGFAALPWLLEFIIKVIVITFVLILFCEALPKLWANNHNIAFAKNSSLLVQGAQLLFGGMANWLTGLGNRIEKTLGNKNSENSSIEELRQAIQITDEKDISHEEKEILVGISKFGHITVKQIMKSRLDVNGIEHQASFDTVVTQIADLHYSRLPVYDGTLDNIKGMLHTKDVLPHLQQAANYNWHGLMRKAYFVHEQKQIEDLLQEFKRERIHFAIVVDEFGGTSGIITLEDILEEIVGDIKDEFDEEDATTNKIDDNNYIFEGKTSVPDCCKIMGLPETTFDVVRGQSDTIAGLVLEIAGVFPQVNQVLPCGDFDFTVTEINKNRIGKVKVKIKPRPE